MIEPALMFKLVHLLGFAAGFGGAMLSGFTLVKLGVLKPMSHEAIRQTRSLARYALGGLMVLALSGAGLAAHKLAMDPDAAFNPKLWIKLGAVAALAINTLLIYAVLFPRMERSLGRRLLLDGPQKEGALNAFVISLALVSWWGAFILGAAPEPNPLAPAWKLAAVYAASVLLVWSLWLAAINSASASRNASLKRALTKRASA